MTEQNMKKLYEHYITTGQRGMANDILKIYPQFAEPQVPPEPEPQEETEQEPKSKGKK